MAITNYSELKTTIANWLDRSDLTTVIPDFIAIAEAKMHRGNGEINGLRLRDMEQAATRDTVSGQERYGLPSDFLEMRNISYVRNSLTVDLPYRAPRQMDEEYSDDNTGYPEVFSIEGDELRLRPIPSGAWTLRQVYYKRLDALSDSNTSNAILTDHPDIYLYGAMSEAELYLKNDARSNLWDQRFWLAVAAANNHEERGRRKGGAHQATAKVGAYKTRGI